MATRSRPYKGIQGKKRHFRRSEDLAEMIRDRLTATTGEALPAQVTPTPQTAAIIREPSPSRESPSSAPVSASVQAAWRVACGERLPDAMNRTSLIRQDDAVLVVYVESPVWATRIRLAAPSLIRALQANGMPEITDLRIRVLPRDHASPAPEKRTAALTPRSAKVIDGIAQRMGSSDLGESLRRLAKARKNASTNSDEDQGPE